MARARIKAGSNGHSVERTNTGRYFIADKEVSAETHGRYQQFVRNAMHKLAENAMLMRADWLRNTAGKDPRRDIEKDCGYNGAPTVEDFDELCRKEAVAERVATVWAEESWQTYPDIYESDNELEETDFEKALSELETGLGSPGSKSYMAERTNSRLMDVLYRADKAAGRGRYSVVLVGLNDGIDLRRPVRGVKEVGSGAPVDSAGTGDRVFYNFAVNAEAKLNRVKFLRVYPERYARITRVENNLSSPRYGMPTEYEITEQDVTNYGLGVTQQASRLVHWSRVVHVVTNAEEGNEVLGRPELQVPYRRVMDLQKLYGGSAEMYWLGAFGGIAFEAAADLLDAGADMQSMKDEVELYMNGLQRFLRLIGVQAKSLAPQVVDPRPQIEAQVDAICIYLKMPKRIFMGSERGELASSQDDAAWNDRVKHRQMYTVVPRVIFPFINHLITIKALPEPGEDGFKVRWPDITSQSDDQKSLIAVNRTKAMGTYAVGGLSEFMSPLDFLVKEMRFDADEAQKMLESAQQAKREAQAETALANVLAMAEAQDQGGGPEQAQQQGQPQQPGQPPAGLLAQGQAPQKGASQGRFQLSNNSKRPRKKAKV